MATGRSCHPWRYDDQNPHFRFLTEDEQEAAVFLNFILEWAAQVGLKGEYWAATQRSYRSTILKAIRAIWNKSKCKLGVCYEYEREPDTYYIPLGVCIKDAKSLALVHWSDMMRRNPKYFEYRVPNAVQLALINFQQRIENPWDKPIRAGIADRDQMPALTWQAPSQQEEETVTDTVQEDVVQQTFSQEWQSWEQERYPPWTSSEPPWRSQWRGWQERGSSSSSTPSTWFGWRTYG